MCTTTTKQKRLRDERKYLEYFPEFKKFVPYKNADNAGDYDTEHLIREFSGKMTKERWRKIDHICRFFSRPFQYRCGHDWDCCGCIFQISMEFEYSLNLVTIHLRYYHNY